jgi:hypothetical protein
MESVAYQRLPLLHIEISTSNKIGYGSIYRQDSLAADTLSLAAAKLTHPKEQWRSVF